MSNHRGKLGARQLGKIKVGGIDYQVTYKARTAYGEWSPSITATQTYKYTVALKTGRTRNDRVSTANTDFNWAPRWKATAALGWKLGPYLVDVGGRYLGRYRDYSPLVNGTYQQLGSSGFWMPAPVLISGSCFLQARAGARALMRKLEARMS